MQNVGSGRIYMQSTTILALVFLCNLGALGQSNLATAANSTPPIRNDLNATLADLMRTAPATDQDLAGLHLGGKIEWLTFWRRDAAHKAQIAEAVRRNLEGAVPNLTRDAQSSHGSISSTFKLYNDLSVVCESLDSLLPPGSRKKNAEFTALSNDLSDLNRLREEISYHIQQTAAVLESKNPDLVSSTGRPKKIIVDDDTPEKTSPKKRRSRQ